MMSNNDIPEVYNFQGKKGEKVPESVKKLTINYGVQVVPDELCNGLWDLQQVTLPVGMKKIGNGSFGYCQNLSEINKIPHTVQIIEQNAFELCECLKKVEFEDTPSSPHQLTTIGYGAFFNCISFRRIKPPSSLTTIGGGAFHSCSALMEADLSKTRITEIANEAFAYCDVLQTVCLPNTVRIIEDSAFAECTQLVTVVVPLGSSPITIGYCSFNFCYLLANIVLPEGSAADEEAFAGCSNLHDRFGTESAEEILKKLICRFGDFPINKLCYKYPRTTPQELKQFIEEQEKGMEHPVADEFGMTRHSHPHPLLDPRAEHGTT